jgi:hypothetical protein
MQSTDTLVKLVIWHKDYNPDKKNNLDDVPGGKAVFGIFGIVNEEPVNCRFVGETENLHKSIKGLFENPEGEGLKKFMQGPWIQILQYEIMEGSSQEERKKAVEAWTEKYKPGIDNEGEYPGYYDN